MVATDRDNPCDTWLFSSAYFLEDLFKLRNIKTWEVGVRTKDGFCSKHVLNIDMSAPFQGFVTVKKTKP